MKNYLFVLVVCFILVGCTKDITPFKTKKEYRASKKVAKLLAAFPNIIKSDSIFKKDSSIENVAIEGEFYDVNKENQVHEYIDSLLIELANKCPQLFEVTDTTIVESKDSFSIPVKNNALEGLRKRLTNMATIENLMNGPLLIDSAGIKVKLWANGNALYYQYTFPIKTIHELKEKTTVIPCPDCPEESYWRSMWAVKEVIGILLLLIGFLCFLIVIMK